MKDHPLVVRWVTAAAVVLWISGPAAAQRRLTFNPYLYLEQTYTNNAGFTTLGQGDYYTRAAVVLPVSYDLRRQGNLFVSYEYFVDRYNDLEQFDKEGHRFNLAYIIKPTQPSQFRIGASYTRRDDQGRIGSRLQEDLFLTPRLRREILRVGVGYRRQLSATWSSSAGVTYADYDLDRVISSQDDNILTAVQGRSGWIYDASLGKRLSERSTTGFGYSYSDFTLDPVAGDPVFNREGEEQIHSAYWFWRYTFGPLWRLDLRLGGYKREGFSSDGRPLDREGGIAHVSGVRSFRRTELEVFGSYAPTSEGLLRGTSTITTVGAALRDITPGRWDWEIFGQTGRRDPADPAEDEVDAIVAGGYLQWHLQRLLTLRLSTLYQEQRSDNFLIDLSAYRVSLALYYFPLGRTRIGGAPAVPFADFEE